MGIPVPHGVLFPGIVLFLSMTYVFLTILLFIRDQMEKIYQSIRTHPKDSSWLLGLYAGTYIISCSLMMTELKPIIRFDGVFVVIYLASITANLISLWQISNRVFTRPERSDVLRYIEEVKALRARIIILNKDLITFFNLSIQICLAFVRTGRV